MSTGDRRKAEFDFSTQVLRNEIHEVTDRINRSYVLRLEQDPEDFVVLRGSTEALIELAERGRTDGNV